MNWEFDFLSALHVLYSPASDMVMAVLSKMGDAGMVWIAVGLILFAVPKTRRIGAEVILSMLLTYILGNVILKNLVDRPRPYEAYQALEPLIARPHESSFPSGHTMNGFAAATAIFLNNKKAGAAALLLAAAIGFSRLYNLVHYPTDVLGGMVVGIGMALCVHFVVAKRIPWDRFRSKKTGER